MRVVLGALDQATDAQLGTLARASTHAAQLAAVLDIVQSAPVRPLEPVAPPPAAPVPPVPEGMPQTRPAVREWVLAKRAEGLSWGGIAGLLNAAGCVPAALAGARADAAQAWTEKTLHQLVNRKSPTQS